MTEEEQAYLNEKLGLLEQRVLTTNKTFEDFATTAFVLAEKARSLVYLLDDAEANHGGLIDVGTLRARNELRLELARWK